MNLRRACLGGFLALTLFGCRGKESPAGGASSGGATTGAEGSADPTKVVAEFADRTLTVGDLDKYFQSNLYLDEGVEDISLGDLLILKSRLFDSFIDEQLLLHEARLAGIEVSSEEVEAYVQATASEDVNDAKTEAIRRDMARNDLTIQKLRSTWVEKKVSVTPAEIAEYVTAHRQDLEPGKSLTLRSLMLASEDQARSIAAAITSKKLSFDQAVETPGANKSQAEPTKVPLDSLPAEVRDAVEDLGAGQVSEPVLVNGRPFLFYVVSWVKPAGAVEDAIRQRAEASLRQLKQEDASREQVDGARQRVPTKIYTERLPFQYVPVD